MNILFKKWFGENTTLKYWNDKKTENYNRIIKASKGLGFLFIYDHSEVWAFYFYIENCMTYL